jgi:hypothetical protein
MPMPQVGETARRFGLWWMGSFAVCFLLETLQMLLMSLETVDSPFHEGWRQNITVTSLFHFEDFQHWDVSPLLDPPNSFSGNNIFQPCQW